MYRFITQRDLEELYVEREQEIGYARFSKYSSSTSKTEIYFKNGQKCAFPNCSETRMELLTKDHIVPISVAYYLNWTFFEVRDVSNMQLLCQKHHNEKDKQVNELRKLAYLLRESKRNKGMREVAMLIGKNNIPLVTYFGDVVTTDFHFFDYARDVNGRFPGLIERMVHTHPKGAKFISEEDRTTLKAWTMAFAPYPIILEVICEDFGGGIFRSEYWYELEPLGLWLLGDKSKARKMELRSNKIKQDHPDWVNSIMYLSSENLLERNYVKR